MSTGTQVTDSSFSNAYRKMAGCCMQTNSRKRQVVTCRKHIPALPRWRRKLESGVHSGTRWNCGGTGGVARRDCQAIAYSGGIPDRPCRKDNEDLLVDTILRDCIDDQGL